MFSVHSLRELNTQNIDFGVLPAAVPDINSGENKSFGRQIESLSGVFCKAVQEPQSHLVTNDRNMGLVLPHVRERLRQQSGGIGIFVGSGALTSLAPELAGLDFVVNLDINDVVLEFNNNLNQAVVREAEILDGLGKQSSICRHIAQTITRTKDAGYTTSFIEQEISWEASRFGDEHWSNPARVKSVADALKEKEIISVAADLSDSRFIRALAELCRQQNQSITFANLTNVHEWVGQSDMSFLHTLPFASNAIIMYSIDNGAPLQSKLADSLEEYVQTTRNSWRPFMADID